MYHPSSSSSVNLFTSNYHCQKTNSITFKLWSIAGSACRSQRGVAIFRFSIRNEFMSPQYHIQRWKPICHGSRIPSYCMLDLVNSSSHSILYNSARSFPNPPGRKYSTRSVSILYICRKIPVFTTKYTFLHHSLELVSPDYQHWHLSYLIQSSTAVFSWCQGPQSVLLICRKKWTLSQRKRKSIAVIIYISYLSTLSRMVVRKMMLEISCVLLFASASHLCIWRPY